MRRLLFAGLFLILSSMLYAEEIRMIGYRVVNENFIEGITEDGGTATIPVNPRNNEYLNYLKWVNIGNKANDPKTPIKPTAKEVRREWLKIHPLPIVIKEEIQPDT